MAQSRARWSVAAILLLAGVCAASRPPQRLGPNAKPRAVSDEDWTPRFEVEAPSGRERPQAQQGEREPAAEIPNAAREHPRCPAVLPPKPLATPLPTFPKAGHGNLKIHFVIGTDGRLHKLAVLNSAGRVADSKAVNTLRQWRYKPAMCNGIPMEAEGTVEFPGW